MFRSRLRIFDDQKRTSQLANPPKIKLKGLSCLSEAKARDRFWTPWWAPSCLKLSELSAIVQIHSRCQAVEATKSLRSQNTTNTNSHRAFSELKKRCLAPRDTTMAMVDLDHGPGKSSGKSADPCRCCCFWLLLLLLLLLPLLVPVVSAGQWYIIV